MVARVAANTGWSWDHIEATLTTARLTALTRHWQANPPLPEVVAALARQPQDSGNLDDLARMIGGG